MARILELKGVRPHGVDVGHQFFSPCEMVTVGFHNHWLSGIDYIGASFQQRVRWLFGFRRLSVLVLGATFLRFLLSTSKISWIFIMQIRVGEKGRRLYEG
ncbi:putative [histone H3]-lysine(4) N-trimethyltransferase [Helianthus annuus]|nr:putative [histone H3]-lysine(4) N-trimethyltransferase [Helianthus annuus]KAJ0928222.1 putative [histone H3]-lysine(4) N-trimethyltransferase [Helianthus annuus]